MLILSQTEKAKPGVFTFGDETMAPERSSGSTVTPGDWERESSWVAGSRPATALKVDYQEPELVFKH